MKQTVCFIILITFIVFSCRQNQAISAKNEIKIIPISHGTLVLEYDDMVIYVDPVGGAEAFMNQNPPEIILITDIHGDHLNIETLKSINSSNPKIVAPVAVANRLPEELKTNLSVLSNFQSITLRGKNIDLGIEGIPMYNLREEALKFHEKGRGNGYVLSLGDKRIYISGDTEDIAEMKALKNIDLAFICMNLPWTMTIESAAEAVLEFNPKHVYPYHYKGTNGFSDVEKFKSLINEKSKTIDVHLLNWYSNR